MGARAEDLAAGLAGEVPADRPLAAVGLSEAEERAYVLLVGAPQATAAEVAEGLGVPVRRAQAVLRALQVRGLVSRVLSRPPGYLAAPPDVVLPALVLRRQEELQQVRLAAVDLAEQGRRAAARGERGPELLELVAGPEAITACFDQLQRAAEREVCVLDRPPYAVGGPVNPAEFAVLARGLAYRAIYDPAALAGPGQPEALRRYLAAGEQARVFPDVPAKMVVVDARTALIPLDAHHPGSEALLVRASAVVDMLQMLFETLWRQATPLAAGLAEAAGPARVAPKGAAGELVALLAAGLKDEAIARRLGISPRTLDRRVRALLQELAVGTRFQAGWQAALRYHAPAPSDSDGRHTGRTAPSGTAEDRAAGDGG